MEITMNNNTFMSVRVSSFDQKEDRQLLAMNEVSIRKENIYIDKLSDNAHMLKTQ